MKIKIENIYFPNLKDLKLAIAEGRIEIEKVENHNLDEYFVFLLNNLTDQYFYQTAQERGDYKNMGEIYIDAQANDPDAQFLLKLYDAVWKKEEELEQELQKMGLEGPLNLDLQKWAYQKYDQVKEELEEGA